MILLRLFAGAFAAVILVALVATVLDPAVIDIAVQRLTEGFREIAELGKDLAESGQAREIADKLTP